MQTLKVLFWNVLFLGVFVGLSFAALEFYLRSYQTFSTETVSAVGVPIFEADTATTYHHRPGVKTYNGYGVPTPQIIINNAGLRNAENIEPSSVEKKRNVLMLGDSFTFGTGVDQTETFTEGTELYLNQKPDLLNFSAGREPGWLATSLRLNPTKTSFLIRDNNVNATPWQFWNGGHIGFSIGQYYLLLKRYANLMPLDTVVVNVFVANDITELRRKNWLKDAQGDLEAVQDVKVFANKEDKLESRTTRVPTSLAWHWVEQRLKILQYKLELADPEFAEPTLTWPVFLSEDHPAWDPHLPQYWERFFQVMQQMADFAFKKNIKLVFVLHPMDVQVDGAYRTKYARIYFDQDAEKQDRPQQKIMSFCAARQLNCLDLLPVFRARPDKDKLYFNYNADPHYDRLGHQVTAETISRYLESLDS